jgi:type I restriction enzyme, S subunit
MSIELPKDWNILELKELIDKKRSIRYGIVQPGEYDQNGRYMVRGQDYSFGWVEPENLFKVSDAIESKYKNARLKKGDIILTIVGAGTGTVAIVPEWLDGANCTQTTARIAIEPSKADSLYCYYYLSSYKGKKLTYQNIKGGAQPGLNCGDIENFEIILPPQPEQRAIAQVLSTADAAIHTTEKLIAQKELRKKWLMQQLLTGKKRLKGFEGEWKEVRLKDVTTNFSRRNKGLVDAKVYSVTNKSGFVLQSDHFEGKVAGEDLSNYKIIKKNEFAYNPARVNVGSLAYFEKEIGVISSLYVCFKTTNDVLDYFLLQFLQIDHTKHRIDALGEGGVRVYLWYDLFSKIKIKIPSIEEQTAIAQVLQAADKEISLLKVKAEKLREQKKGLMQVLLTGKVRLTINKKI